MKDSDLPDSSTPASNFYVRVVERSGGGTVVGSRKTILANIGSGITSLTACPTINGGTAANDDITIQGTSHSTRTSSYVILQPSGGNVGIGLSSPTAKLEIFGGSDVVAIGRNDGTDATDSDQLVVKTRSYDGNTAIRLVDRNGNDTFAVNDFGQISVQNLGGFPGEFFSATFGKAIDITGVLAGCQISDRATLSNKWQMYSTDGMFRLWKNFGAGGNEPFVVTSGGNIGVGTGSPHCPLHVQADFGGAPIVRIEGGSATSYTQLEFKGNARIYQVGAGNGSETVLGVANKFFLYDANAVAMRLVVDTSGNVGIGTTTPAEKLDIVGNILLSGVLKVGSTDTGLGRVAAGVVKLTDGSTGIRALQGGGAAVASAAALPVPTGRVFHVTGTTNITSITSTNLQAGVVITMIFDDILMVTDGNNLKLVSNFTTALNSTLSLIYDGSNWFETARSLT